MSTVLASKADDLLQLEPSCDSFVGVDSDGCVFDTMELKQRECFHSLIISHWRLEPIAQYVRETAEFVNLRSKWRGRNRFLNLLKTFQMLGTRPEVTASGVELPDLSALRRLADSGVPLGNAELAKAVGRTCDATLESVLRWSELVNNRIAAVVKAAPPFPWAVKGLKLMQGRSDVVCVSQTPAEALLREWRQSGLLDCVRAMAGQEIGSKSEHLRLAAGGKYAAGRVLMIGDAPGDMAAAKDNGALFFPVKPGAEDESWRLFCEEAYDRFLAGSYAGAYEANLTARFDALLPAEPPWEIENSGNVTRR